MLEQTAFSLLAANGASLTQLRTEPRRANRGRATRILEGCLLPLPIVPCSTYSNLLMFSPVEGTIGAWNHLILFT